MWHSYVYKYVLCSGVKSSCSVGLKHTEVTKSELKCIVILWLSYKWLVWDFIPGNIHLNYLQYFQNKAQNFLCDLNCYFLHTTMLSIQATTCFGLNRLKSSHHYNNFKIRYNTVQIMLVVWDPIWLAKVVAMQNLYKTM
jgi:hypothetical protein